MESGNPVVESSRQPATKKTNDKTMPSSRVAAKAGTSSSAGTNDNPPIPSETPKDLKKRVSALNKSLSSVHERLIQTEKQIFDLERSYLEETRLYGNVLQGWDAYLETKGKSKMGEGLRTKRDRKDCADVAGGEEDVGEGGSKRSKGVELEDRLFSLGSVTSPAAKGLQKQEEKRRASEKQGDVGSPGGGGGASSPDAGSSPSNIPKTPKTLKLLKSPKDKKADGKGVTEAEGLATVAGGVTAVAGSNGGRNTRKESARKESVKKEATKKESSKKKKRAR